MSTITVRDAKIEDAARILEIYAYYVEHTAVSYTHLDVYKRQADRNPLLRLFWI